MVEQQPSKLMTTVRFRSPAPAFVRFATRSVGYGRRAKDKAAKRTKAASCCGLSPGKTFKTGISP
jgi:hypothetical protein